MGTHANTDFQNYTTGDKLVMLSEAQRCRGWHFRFLDGVKSVVFTNELSSKDISHVISFAHIFSILHNFQVNKISPAL